MSRGDLLWTPPDELRSEAIRRFALAAGKVREWPAKRNPITPV